MSRTIEGFIEDFGKTVGLVHKAMVMGRKVGAGARFWTALADNEELFRMALQLVRNFPRVEIDLPERALLEPILKRAGFMEQGRIATSRRERWVESYLCEAGAGPRTVEIVDLSEFAHVLTITHANECLAKMGYRGALPEELAAIGVERSADFPVIIAPGKPIELGYDDERRLDPNEDQFLAIGKTIPIGRTLETVWRSGKTWTTGWRVNTEHYRFAAIRTTKLPIFEL